MDSSNSLKVLGIQAYSRQKTLEIYLDKDLHLDSQKARSSVKVLDSASRDVIDKVLVQGSRLIITGEFKPNATYSITYSHPIDEKDTSLSFPSSPARAEVCPSRHDDEPRWQCENRRA